MPVLHSTWVESSTADKLRTETKVGTDTIQELNYKAYKKQLLYTSLSNVRKNSNAFLRGWEVTHSPPLYKQLSLVKNVVVGLLTHWKWALCWCSASRLRSTIRQKYSCWRYKLLRSVNWHKEKHCCISKKNMYFTIG